MNALKNFSDTPRYVHRNADIEQIIQAAALAGSHYPRGEFQRGYMAALGVIAAALGVDGPDDVEAVTIDVLPVFERPRNWRRE